MGRPPDNSGLEATTTATDRDEESGPVRLFTRWLQNVINRFNGSSPPSPTTVAATLKELEQASALSPDLPWIDYVDYSTRVVHLKAARTIEQIPDNQLCETCGGLTTKVPLGYKHPFTLEGEPYFTRLVVPGYRCNNCGEETYDPDASQDALEVVRKTVEAAQDKDELVRVEALIDVGKRHLASFQ